MQHVPACSTSLGSFALPWELPAEGSQHQIHHKEAAKEDKRAEEERWEDYTRSILGPVEDVSPAFQSDALEDGEHGLQNIVKSSHPIETTTTGNRYKELAFDEYELNDSFITFCPF